MVTECRGGAGGNFKKETFELFLFSELPLPDMSALIIHIHVHILFIGEVVHSGNEEKPSFMTYPVLLWVADAPSGRLRCSAQSLLLLSGHGNLPLDTLLERGCRPGVWLLYWAACGLRRLSSLDGNV